MKLFMLLFYLYIILLKLKIQKKLLIISKKYEQL